MFKSYKEITFKFG